MANINELNEFCENVRKWLNELTEKTYSAGDIKQFNQSLDQAAAQEFFLDTSAIDRGFTKNFLLELLIKGTEIQEDASEEVVATYLKCFDLVLHKIRSKSPIDLLNVDEYKGLAAVSKTTFSNVEIKCMILKLLIKHGAKVNPDSMSPRSSTIPLFCTRESKVIETLLKNGADPNVVANSSNCPDYGISIIESILLNNIPDPYQTKERDIEKSFTDALKSLKILLKYGASPNAGVSLSGKKLHSSLMTLSSLKRRMLFSKSPDWEILFDDFALKALDLLLKAGADINYKDMMGDDVVTVCSCAALLKKYAELGLDITRRNNKDETLLNTIISDRARFEIYNDTCSDTLTMLDEYLDCKGPVNIPSFPDDETAIFVAVRNEDKEVIQKLAAAGADLNFRNRYGDYAASGCFYKNPFAADPELMRLLIEAGMDLTVTDSRGRNMLHRWALKIGTSYMHNNENLKEKNLRVLEILVNAGADINAKNDFGKTPATTLLERVSPKNFSLVMPYLFRMIDMGMDLYLPKSNRRFDKSALDLVPYKKYKKLLIDYAEHTHNIQTTIESGIEEFER